VQQQEQASPDKEQQQQQQHVPIKEQQNQQQWEDGPDGLSRDGPQVRALYTS
jgi:hypothetical protein